MIDLKHSLWRLSWKIRSWRAKSLQPGETFPDFSLKDVDGREHALSQSKGNQFTLLWFTNLCEDCRSKIPILDELQHEANDQFRILAISILNVDSPLPYELSKSCAFPMLLDPEDVVGKRLGLAHPPGTCPLHNLFILSKGGRILFRGHLSALSRESFSKIWRGLL